MKTITRTFAALLLFIVGGVTSDSLNTVSARTIATSTEPPAQPMSSQTGVVKFYNKAKKFGFIIVDGTDKEIFFHESGLIDEVEGGVRVEFDLENGRKGLVAVNIRRI